MIINENKDAVKELKKRREARAKSSHDLHAKTICKS